MTGAGLLAAFAGLGVVQPATARPELWDGRAAGRIGDVLADWMAGR
jgi:hypothetical protein